MSQTNAELISETLKDKILDELGNEEISSKELDLLIDEVGEIVVSIQTLFLQELYRLENKLEHSVSLLSNEVNKLLETKKLEQKDIETIKQIISKL